MAIQNNPFRRLTEAQFGGGTNPLRQRRHEEAATANAGAMTALYAAGLQGQGASKAGTPQGLQGVQFSGGDELARFKSQMSQGAVNPNLNKPALPFFASRDFGHA